MFSNSLRLIEGPTVNCAPIFEVEDSLEDRGEHQEGVRSERNTYRRTPHLQSSTFDSEDRRTPHLRSSAPKNGSKIGRKKRVGLLRKWELFDLPGPNNEELPSIFHLLGPKNEEPLVSTFSVERMDEEPPQVFFSSELPPAATS